MHQYQQWEIAKQRVEETRRAADVRRQRAVARRAHRRWGVLTRRGTRGVRAGHGSMTESVIREPVVEHSDWLDDVSGAHVDQWAA